MKSRRINSWKVTSSDASIAVPLKLDPLATQGDGTFFAMLANLGNLPGVVRADLPGRYGEVPRSHVAVAGLADDDTPIAPLPLRELPAREI